MKRKIRVGDLVRVRHAMGDGVSESRWQVTLIDGTACLIKEWPGVPGKKMAAQHFDTSLLVVDNSGPKQLTRMLNREG